MHEVDLAVLDEARLTILRAQWQMLHEAAIARLADRRGLARTPLCPPWDTIQVVTLNGIYVGRIRRAHSVGRSAKWLATRPGGLPIGPFRTARAAAAALR